MKTDGRIRCVAVFTRRGECANNPNGVTREFSEKGPSKESAGKGRTGVSLLSQDTV